MLPLMFPPPGIWPPLLQTHAVTQTVPGTLNIAKMQIDFKISAASSYALRVEMSLFFFSSVNCICVNFNALAFRLKIV